jgi:hypothetical protein
MRLLILRAQSAGFLGPDIIFVLRWTVALDQVMPDQVPGQILTTTTTLQA